MKKNFLKNLIVINNLSNKEKLALALTFLVVLVILMNLVYSVNGQDSLIKYEEFNVGEVINISEEIYDRQLFYDLTKIISSIISSYNLEINSYHGYIDYDVINYKLEDYYEALHSDYKKYITRNEYLDLSSRICEKFMVTGTYGQYIHVDKNIIKNIYLMPEEIYGKGLYICCLNTKVANTTSYIGIELNKHTNKYSIFYLE